MIEPSELRLVDRADVWVDDQLVATLTRRNDRVRFEYLPGADLDVATTLPRRDLVVDTHAPGALPPFFSGLLPEGRRLSAVRRLVKTSADDEFSLLLAVGQDTIGNVSIVPSGATADDISLIPAIAATESDWDKLDFADLFQQSVGPNIDRVAIPGVQDKVSARMITMPLRLGGQSMATHILKLNPPEFPHLVENEAFFAEAARAADISIAETRLIHDRHGFPGLLVKRFDREVTATRARRLAQEDACQVLGRYPADKYLMTAEQVALGLRGQCSAAPVAAAALLGQFAFAYLTCNGDGHAKNFSILRHGREWRVSPAYDVPSSYPYRDRTMAISLNKKNTERLGINDFLAFSASLNLREKPARRILATIADSADKWIDGIETLPFDERRNHDLRRAIVYRQRRLRGG
jgi:serine/threonine-protein kinase HipA